MLSRNEFQGTLCCPDSTELLRGKLNRLSPIQSALSHCHPALFSYANRRPPYLSLANRHLVRQPAPSASPTGAPPLANRRPSPAGVTPRCSRTRHSPPTSDDLSSTCDPHRHLLFIANRSFGAPSASRPALHQIAEPAAHDDGFKVDGSGDNRLVLRFSCVANGVCLWRRRSLRFARHMTASLIASLLLRCIPRVPVVSSVPSLRSSRDGVAH